MNDVDAARLALLEALREQGYRFVTPTPATHARVVARADRQEAVDLMDVLGWSLAFREDVVEPEMLGRMRAAEMIVPAEDGRWRSTLRVSSLKGQLYLHSAYPTEHEDAVFFGPDSYRFADLIEAELSEACPERGRIVDIGTGSGVGAIVAARACPEAETVMTDINPEALRLAAVNARAAGVVAHGMLGDGLADLEGEIDLVLANPPYIIDAADRAYRNGGGMLGGQVSFDMAAMAAERLAPGGRLILYTGSAIRRGEDLLRGALEQLAGQRGLTFRYREIDPDIFGEELSQPAYAEVDRICAVAAVLTRR